MTTFKRRPDLICTPAHEYFWRGQRVPGNTEVLRAAGYGHDFAGWSDLERGRHVHLACRYLTEGRLRWATVAQRLLPYVQGWAGFLRVSGVKVWWMERMLYCHRYGFATRPDCVGALNGRAVVIQIKTGSVEPSVGPQTAGEALAVKEQLGHPVDRFAVVLPGNGWFRLEALADPADQAAFFAALTSWNARRRQGWNGRGR